jgi:TRAP-type C4-dicarboxylate transport system permease small subunit
MQFLGAADRLLTRLYLWCGYIAAALLVTLAGLVILSIVSRLLGTYVPGVTEYSGYAMAGASFFALAYTFRERGHIRVGILLNILHGRARWLVEIWCLLVASFFSGFLAFYLVKMTRVSWQLGDRSEGADAIHLWIPQTLVGAGAVVLAICVLHQLIRVLFGAELPEKGGSRAEPSGEP